MTHFIPGLFTGISQGYMHTSDPLSEIHAKQPLSVNSTSRKMQVQ